LEHGIPPGGRVLFIGDSVTEAGRDPMLGEDLGRGYAMQAAAWFTLGQPRAAVRFTNRGLGGNRVRDLCERWEKDCLSLAPDLVTVLIGINDTWRRFDSDDPTSTEEFERDYRDILRQTRVRTSARLVLIEPFLLPVRAEQYRWRSDLDPRIGVTRRLAAEFGALLVPADGLFAQAAAVGGDPRIWCGDGVHPTPAGHALLARAWLSTVGADPHWAPPR
jgi:lysophospholipase L1-like esterase